MLLGLPAVVRAQFNFKTNSGTITITAYTGSGGAVTIPSMTNGLPVTSIGNGAFQNKAPTSVIIPDSITNIGSDAFFQCGTLTNVTLGTNITDIGNSAFYFCVGLTSIIIPNSVTNIEEEAFVICKGLTSVTIGKSVNSIGMEAFDNCTSLTNITIPTSVTNIGDYAFFASTNLTSIYFAGNAPNLGANSLNLHNNPTVYYLPGTMGWSTTFGLVPTLLWNPQAQTSDGGFGVQTNGFGFNITGSSNLVIVVEACTNLTNPVWSPVATNTLNMFIGTNGTSYFSDPQWTNYPGRFYRFSSP